MKRLLLLGFIIAMQSCTQSAPRNTGVYLLVDTSGTYSRQVNKADRSSSTRAHITGGLLQAIEFLNEKHTARKEILILAGRT
jgi:hypothetical protein